MDLIMELLGVEYTCFERLLTEGPFCEILGVTPLAPAFLYVNYVYGGLFTLRGIFLKTNLLFLTTKGRTWMCEWNCLVLNIHASKGF